MAAAAAAQASLSLSGGIRFHCTASISYRSDIFISLCSQEGKKGWTLAEEKKTHTGWTPCVLVLSLDDTTSTVGESWGEYRRKEKARRDVVEGW